MPSASYLAFLTKMQKAQKDLPKILAAACETATIAAVEAATAATPPKEGTGRGPYMGANTVTGALKQHWASDSRTKPSVEGGTIRTELRNNLQYASYVNDGHRMERHFVPGLHIGEGGLLEYVPDKDVGGLVVGTKTPYVKGEFMVDKAKEVYQKTLEKELKANVREVFY